MDANARIQDTVGNMPMEASKELNQAFVECVEEIFGKNQLLKEDAKRGRALLSEFKPVFASKKEYFEAVEAMRRDLLAVEYMEDNEAKLIY